MIKQIWISTQFGVISKQLPVADVTLNFIRPVVLPSDSAVKRLLAIFQLAATRVALALPNSAQAWAVAAKDVAMQQVARETWITFERRRERVQVPEPRRPDYHRWIRCYLDSAANTAIRHARPPALGHFSASGQPKSSR